MEVKQGQSFWDLVVQLTGDIDNAFAMSLLNDRSTTDLLALGDTILPNGQIKKNVVNLFTEDNIPATYEAYPSNDVNAPNIGGIGFMGIEETFIIS